VFLWELDGKEPRQRLGLEWTEIECHGGDGRQGKVRLGPGIVGASGG